MKRDDEKEMIFYQWDSEKSSQEIERFKKTAKAAEITPPSARELIQFRSHIGKSNMSE